MSNNQQYDNKCFNHPYQDIVFICSNCPNYIPVCIDCINDGHRGHTFKKLNDIHLRNQIQQEFNDQTIPKLNNYLENNKKILEESNNHFKQINDNHTKNFEKAFKIFKELRDFFLNIINAKEIDVKLLLTTKLNKNTDINNIITTIIEKNNNIINNAIKFNNDINNNNDDVNNNDDDVNNNNNEFIKLLKHNHQCNNLLSNINNNSLPEYKDTQLIIQENNLDSIKDLINSYLEVIDIPLDLKTLKFYNKEFTIYQEGCDISHLEIINLAIGPIECLPKTIPATVTHLLLLDGFDQPLNFIPPTVQYLYLQNIKYQLTPDSIPATVTHLYLLDGFNQPLNFIPPTVQYLYLHNIKYQLTPDSIPATVTHLYLLDGFDQPLDFIPPTVQRLNLHNIKYQLKPGSIPNHLTFLIFGHGFSQRITKGIIPDSITYIQIGDVDYPLDNDSISNPKQKISYLSTYKHLKSK
ncbi:hypothetical protein DICPUDRAFT_150840 [Dictyostelium purpureum]|uniref:B box-type domain-containing protein n=1 Tax=Dictyostelium purpureum TaxID=5786 RepID=F0ZHD8_DICPU|nr:uncharacterized protein DICPUDRAFT_150840 [Dictyostelium purpureum]EGC36667.1 hypothetical protein DICPUDRAFT_150840 [Dictyostelium purpureum]|eukprot:XP_003286835.1 hypothetical protein DICPUDRAFT_150840 [Dictyostelium purpureum]